jgi:hypothetical protein
MSAPRLDERTAEADGKWTIATYLLAILAAEQIEDDRAELEWMMQQMPGGKR